MTRRLIGGILVVATVVVLFLTGRDHGIGADGPVVRHDTGWWPNGGGSDAHIGGQLEFVDGCLLIDGRAVVWPDGTAWDEEHQRVRLGAGWFGQPSSVTPKAASNPGDTVFGAGGVHGEGPGDSTWDESEAGRAVADCLGKEGALVFNADSDLDVTGAFQ